MDNKFRRFQESEGIPHIIRLTSDAQWEVINEFSLLVKEILLIG